MFLQPSFTSIRANMAGTRTYHDFSKFLGENPYRMGIVSQLYPQHTASFLTEGLGNIHHIKEGGDSYQKINSMCFEWQIDVNFVKTVPLSETPKETGENGSEITLYFPERYYEKYDTLQIIPTKQQLAILHEPVRKADDLWEYAAQLIDNSLEDSLDLDVVVAGTETRWIGTVMPELNEVGYTKYQSNIMKAKNWLKEIRHDISWSERFARVEDTFVKIANGEKGGDYKEVIFKMPKMQKQLMDNFMQDRNNSLLLDKTTMDRNGKCTLFDRETGRPLIQGDGLITQINRYANMFAYQKLSIDLFNDVLLSLTEKSEDAQGNTYAFVCNERCYRDVQVVLAEHLANFQVVDAQVYSRMEGKKINVGAEFAAYNFMGNTIIFKVDRALSVEYRDRGYAVMIDLSADKASGKPAIQGFTLEGKGQYQLNYIAGVGGLNGTSDGAVSTPVAGSKYIIRGYCGIAAFCPYRSAVLIQNV